MSILDERLEFADAVSAAIEAGTANVGDTIDISVARDVGQGQPLYAIITVATLFDGGATTTGTTAFQLVSDSTATPSTDGSQTIHATTDVILGTSLVAGFRFVIPFPAGDNANGAVYERYVGIQQVQAEEGEDDGVVNAFVTLDNVGWTSQPDASN